LQLPSVTVSLLTAISDTSFFQMTEVSVNIEDNIAKMLVSVDCVTLYATNVKDLFMLLEEGKYTIYTYYK
jgi:hypothetical protein